MGVIRKIFAAALLLSLTCSCGVLEDRELCPCWLVFVLDECSGQHDSLEVRGYRAGTLFSDDVPLDEFPSSYEKEVDKGVVRTCAFTGIDRSVLDGYSTMIPEGEQADRIFLHRNTLVCEDEFAYDTVVMHKEWVKVTAKVYIDGKQVQESLDRYRFEVRSGICGVNLLDGTPVPGTFRFEPKANGSGEFVFRIPRHSGQAQELFLDISQDGVLIDAMPLGQMLSSSMLDWTEPSLADAEMDVNLSTGDVLITVVPWVNLGHEDIEF